MEDFNKQTELHSAYLCLKDSAGEDLLTRSEVKHVLQYAGYNPSSEFLEKVWIEDETERISFNDLCKMAEQLTLLTEAEIRRIISNVFIVNNDEISINDLKSLLSMTKRKKVIDEFDIDVLVEEVGGNNGLINAKSISKCIYETMKNLKDISSRALQDRAAEQRINSRTYTKKELSSKIHDSLQGSSFDVEGWNLENLKGSFFLDNEIIISHQYSLEVPDMGPTLIKISPMNFRSSALVVEALAFIFRESADGTRNYIGYTNLRSTDGSNYWTDILKEGKYFVIPFTSGCDLKKRNKDPENEIKIIEKKGKIQLTSDCIRVLEDIFFQMDLDCNKLLNRQEFNLYNWRTSGEVVQDDEWEVVQSNFDVENGELTLSGFISLHQLEAEDNGGDSEDLWLSLETVGYNRFGQQDQASSFTLSVYCQSCRPSLLVSGLKSGGLLLDKAVIRSVMEEALPTAICERSDLIKYQMVSNHRGSIVIQNKSNEELVIRIDCSESENCSSNRQNLIFDVAIDKKSAIVAHQLRPINSYQPWKLISKETIIE